MRPHAARRRLVAASLLLALLAAACGVPSPSPSATLVPSTGPSLPPDTVAPTITARDPEPGAELGARGVVAVTFSEPVRGVDRTSFTLTDPLGVRVDATVTLDQDGRTALLVPLDRLFIGSIYTAALTPAVRDLAGHAMAPLSWQVRSSRQIQFAAGTYDGFQFGASGADLLALKRGVLGGAETASAIEYRGLDGIGYLVVDSGTFAGYWVPGTPEGVAIEAGAAPIPELPICAYLDLPAVRTSYDAWASSVLDTIFTLPKSYAPGDLTDTEKAGLNGGYLIRSVALADLKAMVAAAKADGANLAVQSAYRSYQGQVLTFDGWVSQVGRAEALRTSARPGHSEHQLGTAIDFRAVGGASPWTYPDWATTTEGAWLAANAWSFGWVMSYPNGKESIACYRYEPWHYRYVGREQAAAIHDAGVTPREWLWAQGFGIR